VAPTEFVTGVGPSKGKNKLIAPSPVASLSPVSNANRGRFVADDLQKFQKFRN
jgi:hypothetical protein